jgi:hypothetical protein
MEWALQRTPPRVSRQYVPGRESRGEPDYLVVEIVEIVEFRERFQERVDNS